MKRQYVPTSLDQYINESKSITLKRGYKDRKPVVVGANAPIRNQVLAYVAEGQRVPATDLKRFVAGLNETNANPNAAANMWLRRNGKFFITESKGGVTYFKLSQLGQRIVNTFATSTDQVSEGRKAKVNEKKKYDFKDPKTDEPGIVDDEDEVEEGCSKTNEGKEEKVKPRLGGKLDPKLHNLLDQGENKDEGELDGFAKEISEERRERIEKLIENIQKKKEAEKSVNEAKDEGEEIESSEEDELSFDDLDLSGEDEKGEEGDKKGEEGEEGEESEEEADAEEGDEDLEDVEGEEGVEVDEDEKVEITEFIITVDDVDSAIEELSELEVDAEKVVDPDAEPEEGEEEAYMENEISVPAEQWDALKGWLEDKGVDIEEMFGGEIEVEDVEDEGEGEGEDLEVDLEGEGEEDLEVDLEGEEGEEGEGSDELELDLGDEEEPELEEDLTGLHGTKHEDETNNLIKGAKQVVINYK